MHGTALTAHGRCDLRQAEAVVIAWFEAEGLELTFDQDGVLIGWSDDLPRFSGPAPAPSVAVEVRFYRLDADWIQVRWILRLGEERGSASAGGTGVPAAQPPADPAVLVGDGIDRTEEARVLLTSLREHLERDPRWRIDDP